MIDRRTFIGSVVGGFFVVPLAAEAQQAGKVYRIGLLGQGMNEPFVVERLSKGLRELGRANEAPAKFEERWADDQWDRLPKLAAELVALKVDLIVVHGDRPAVNAAMGATRQIPIVFLWIGDPVGQGLVRSLSHPGGNVTGLSFLGPEIGLKRLELLKQAVPTITRVAVITNHATPDLVEPLRLMQAASKSLGLQLIVFDVRSASDLAKTLEQVERAHVHGMVVQEDFVLDTLVETKDSPLLAFALKHRLPLAAPAMAHGVLIAYAFDWDRHLQQAAILIDKLRKGAKPGDLPIEQPTKFILVTNLKTAKALSVTIPQSLLLRTDKVIR